MGIEEGSRLVRKWLPFFGFSNWRHTIHSIADSGRDDAHALCHFDAEEQWLAVWLPDDENLPASTLEMVVIHELAHGLITLAKEGGVLEEQVCNRLARLITGDWTSRNAEEHRSVTDADFYEGEAERRAMDRHAWVGLVTDGLPDKEREVITALYWEGLSLREAGARFGVNYETVRRWREAALVLMQEAFANLERVFPDADSTTEA